MAEPKVTKRSLQRGRDVIGAKRVVEERGELAVLHPQGPVFNPVYFNLNPGPGFYRGGHYHNVKIETFYVISGTMRLRWIDLHDGREETMTVTEGDLVTIHPRCAHRIEAIETCRAIEYSTSAYDFPGDDHPYAFSA